VCGKKEAEVEERRGDVSLSPKVKTIKIPKIP
jgi:hypothetical protein